MSRQSYLFYLALLLFTTIAWASEPELKDSNKEISLEQDRAELDELRKEIPEDVKRKNDDLAFILKLFEDKKRKPGQISNEFNRTFNRLRRKRHKEFSRERKDFTAQEKKVREKQIADAKKKRKEFLAGSPSEDAKKTFFEEERTARKEYFSDEKEKRNDFESDLRARKKEFDAFLRDKRKEFNDRLRQFKKDQTELKKMEKQVKEARARQEPPSGVTSQLLPENQQYLEDFKKIPNKPGRRLAPTKEK